jgi:hypothetical protein
MVYNLVRFNLNNLFNIKIYLLGKVSLKIRWADGIDLIRQVYPFQFPFIVRRIAWSFLNFNEIRNFESKKYNLRRPVLTPDSKELKS